MSEFDKVIGYQSIKLELMRVCDIIKNPSKYEKLGVTFPKGLLLYGYPGVGKTLFANCFLKESGVKYYICRKNKPNGEFVNSLKSIFDEAKANQPAIILLDDLDKFANEDKDHRDAEEYVTVQSCIDEVNDSQVFVLATANNICKVPESLLRAGRFDKIIEVKNPKGQDAVNIVKYYLSQKQCVKDIDAEEISKILNGCSCVELETIINDAGVYAGFANKEKIDRDDIIKACLRFLYKSSESIQDEGHLNDNETAFHEAGHVVVSEILEPNSVILISIGGHDGNIHGFTTYYRDKDYCYSYNLMKNRILTLLAGKAAIELIYGKYDVGCRNDLIKVKDLVRSMITEYGMLGFNKCNAFSLDFENSEILKTRIEDAVFDEIEKCYMETKEILCKNKEFVENIARAVLIKKVLTINEIQEIKKMSHIYDK